MTPRRGTRLEQSSEFRVKSSDNVRLRRILKIFRSAAAAFFEPPAGRRSTKSKL